MEIYTGFAEVYDIFMDNVPYAEWAGCLENILKEYGVYDGLVLDLGCGTGNMTEHLAERGYDMIGVDNSEEMLEIATKKRGESGHDILYLLQDMCEFELYGTVGAVICVCDCVNYIMDEEELLKVFRLVNNYLDSAGIFIFDFNTQYKYETVLGDRTFAEDRKECSFIWNNYYYEEDRINEYELTLFIQDEDMSGLYRKFQEIHYQRGYSFKEIKELIEKSGLEYVGAYDGYEKKAVSDKSERILVVAREKGKCF